MAMLTAPETAPAAVGLKVTGTVSVPFAARFAGSAGFGAPSVNTPLEDVRPPAGMVSAWLAVTVAVSVFCELTATVPKSTAGPETEAVPAP